MTIMITAPLPPAHQITIMVWLLPLVIRLVNKSGDFFDKTGRAIDNAWQDTKRAVKDAGEAVGDAAKKVGKEIDTALDKDK